MITTTLVTPSSYRLVRNLQFNEYIFLYFDKDNKLKRAVPDFMESFIGSDDSLIIEAMSAEKVAPFRIVRFSEQVQSPIFSIDINETGEVVNHSNLIGNITKLENFLLDSERRRNVSKLLKIRR